MVKQVVCDVCEAICDIDYCYVRETEVEAGRSTGKTSGAFNASIGAFGKVGTTKRVGYSQGRSQSRTYYKKQKVYTCYDCATPFSGQRVVIKSRASASITQVDDGNYNSLNQTFNVAAEYDHPMMEGKREFDAYYTKLEEDRKEEQERRWAKSKQQMQDIRDAEIRRERKEALAKQRADMGMLPFSVYYWIAGITAMLVLAAR